MTLLLLSLTACDPGPDACAEGYVRSAEEHCVAEEIDDVTPADDTGSAASDDTDEPQAAALDASSRADLRMKRWRQLSMDLQGALSLAEDEICREAGLYECSELHAVALGGVSVENGVFHHPGGLGATTGLATERFALQACYNRLRADLELVDAGGEAAVFSAIDLTASDAEGDALTAQVTALYQRLLARDPLDAEAAALVGLHPGVIEDGGANADWAVVTCFTIATTTEFLTY